MRLHGVNFICWTECRKNDLCDKVVELIEQKVKRKTTRFISYNFYKHLLTCTKLTMDIYNGNAIYLICLIVVYRPIRNFFTHCRWRAADFNLCSAVMVIELPHLLWHGASVNNGHLREPVTPTPIAERLALPVLTIPPPNLSLAGWTL